MQIKLHLGHPFSGMLCGPMSTLQRTCNNRSYEPVWIRAVTQPPCISDLASSEFHLFPIWKRRLRGTLFRGRQRSAISGSTKVLARRSYVWIRYIQTCANSSDGGGWVGKSSLFTKKKTLFNCSLTLITLLHRSINVIKINIGLARKVTLTKCRH